MASRFPVTLIVSVEADGEDRGDASNVAIQAIVQALHAGSAERLNWIVTYAPDGTRRTVRVDIVAELNSAARNGALSLSVRADLARPC
jgi:hypothetical protein